MHRAQVSAPSLAAQAIRLRGANLPEASIEIVQAGARLRYRFTAQPTVGSREYRCRIELDRQRVSPQAYVTAPDLETVALGRSLPHIYEHEAGCTRLCLYTPGAGEWHRGLWLTETIVPWAIEWLRYFELWLAEGEWCGGGQHPAVEPRRRWGIAGKQR
jgi:hypothetical protein